MFAAYAERKPENAWGHYMLGLSQWKVGNLDAAEEAFEKALEIDPQHVKSLNNLSRVLLDAGRPNDALARIEHVLELDPSSGEGYRLLGRARTELGQIEDAIDAYKNAILLDERDAWSINNFGLIYLREGWSTQALPPLARAVELRGDVAVFQNNLGIVLEQLGYFSAAADAFGRALALDSGYVKAQQNLERVTGRPDQVGLPPLDLASQAREFVEITRNWVEAEQPDVTIPDSVIAPVPSVVGDTTPATGTR
jgi:tetratricopeptide (TPR) repeat protein